MGQPLLTADEMLLARAEANGYQREVHRESDEVRGRGKTRHKDQEKSGWDSSTLHSVSARCPRQSLALACLEC